MWYDTLPKDKHEETREGLSNFKNPEKIHEIGQMMRKLILTSDSNEGSPNSELSS